MAKKQQKITTSSTAEYFSKNLQQVGFSSATKAVLTTLKEAVDNSLDACEDEGILPDLYIEIEKKGAGTLKNSDLIRIKVEDNGPGLNLEDVAKVFGEYLASSKFGRGRCSRGQQGIGISAATTWAQLTSAKGAQIITKTKKMKKAISATVNVDIKANKGKIKNQESIEWDRPHGLSVEFLIDGRIQLNGEGGLLTYLSGTTLVNPHLKLSYKLPDQKKQTIDRVSKDVPRAPDATMPHPHTMKLGEFIHHSHLFGKTSVRSWLKKGFTRVSDNVLKELVANGLEKKFLDQSVATAAQADMKSLFSVINKTDLMAPTTKSVMTIGEDSLAMSIRRMGEVDFFSVNTRRPRICDFKPVAVEVAIARFKDRAAPVDGEYTAPVTVLRFANRVPLQFDKSSCAIVKAIETVNWRAYKISQSRGNLPTGPYVIAVSVVSPFIKFKNASKETIDASEELVEEIRRALMQAGQKLSRHIRKEHREADLEKKIQHIEQFVPILVQCLVRITKAPATRKKKAQAGLERILGRDVKKAETDLHEAVKGVDAMLEKRKVKYKGKEKETGLVEKESDKADVITTTEDGVEDAGKKPAKRAKSENQVTEADLQKASKSDSEEEESTEAPKKASKKAAKKSSKTSAKKAAKSADADEEEAPSNGSGKKQKTSAKKTPAKKAKKKAAKKRKKARARA